MTNLFFEILLPLFIIWNILGFIILLFIPYTSHTKTPTEMYNPIIIYRNIKVNWFGCLVLTVLFNSLCPALSIGYWIFWLCTVGRKDTDDE